MSGTCGTGPLDFLYMWHTCGIWLLHVVQGLEIPGIVVHGWYIWYKAGACSTRSVDVGYLWYRVSTCGTGWPVDSCTCGTGLVHVL